MYCYVTSSNYYLLIDIDLMYTIISTGTGINATAVSATMTKLTISGAIMNSINNAVPTLGITAVATPIGTYTSV